MPPASDGVSQQRFLVGEDATLTNQKMIERPVKPQRSGLWKNTAWRGEIGHRGPSEIADDGQGDDDGTGNREICA